ncbi:helix-turn-helix domain-containing protein [Methylobacterium sp. SyP6R]|uniref:helix-turn-helix domain-containing protein n=1 Tax=Methylobacterium sp. SyP6R TaxID=2718876 RepID=UPI001F1B55C8|nr:helix-turn-helix domain-containing protein [Methylobacterium sp. SyP6R]MCF4125013.1 hypothetical protein [Methylobacterium sp. SyP6R]
MSDQPLTTRHLSIRHIAVIVAEDYGSSLAEMRGARRRNEDVKPRQVAMYLAHRLIGPGLSAIGRYFNRDHTTVLHAVRAVTEDAERDHVLACRLLDLEERINIAETRAIAGLREVADAPVTAPVTVSAPLVLTRDDPGTLRVIDAVRSYLASRSALALARHTKLEAGARRRADDDFDALASIYREYADARGQR